MTTRISPVSFHGCETTNCDTTSCNRMQETTGSIAARLGEDSPRLPEPIDTDTVNFRGKENGEKKTNFLAASLITIGALGAIALLGAYAHKSDWAGRIPNEKVREFFKKTDVITKPCHEGAAAVKKFCVESYDKILKWIKK